MSNAIINLDAIDKSQKTIFCGFEYETGYIPCGISLPVINRFNAIMAGEADGSLTAEAARQQTLDLVLFFCQAQNPDITADDLKKISMHKLNAFVEMVVHTIMADVAAAGTGADGEGKKKQAGAAL
jgi:hypothetical protein